MDYCNDVNVDMINFMDVVIRNFDVNKGNYKGNFLNFLYDNSFRDHFNVIYHFIILDSVVVIVDESMITDVIFYEVDYLFNIGNFNSRKEEVEVL